MTGANTKHKVTRRRALGIFAVAASLPVGTGFGWLASEPGVQIYQWRGRALGVEAGMQFLHYSRAAVAKAVAASVAEIYRLEAIFSLYRDESELVRLNRDGRLDRASPELIAVLAEARRISEISNGAFDITVQPLWALHRRHYANGTTPKEREVRAILELVDYRGVEVSGQKVYLARPGMRLTLNGIAQGYITDRVAELVRAEGFDRVLLQLGETFGIAPADAPWRIGIEGWSDDTGVPTIPLASAAIATSAGASTPLGAYKHHIFDPVEGGSPHQYSSVAVIADRALGADALSTAIYAAPAWKSGQILRDGGGLQAFIVRRRGESHWLKT